jgi:hypothetical protein
MLLIAGELERNSSQQSFKTLDKSLGMMGSLLKKVHPIKLFLLSSPSALIPPHPSIFTLCLEIYSENYFSTFMIVNSLGV